MTEDSAIDFRSTGGTNGSVYDNLLNHSINWLFCVNKDLNMWLIPVSDLTNKSRIHLRTEPNKNSQGFQTYKYRVQFSNVAP